MYFHLLSFFLITFCYSISILFTVFVFRVLVLVLDQMDSAHLQFFGVHSFFYPSNSSSYNFFKKDSRALYSLGSLSSYLKMFIAT